MDIERERKAFEAVPEIKQWVNALRYGEKTGVYIAIDNDKHEGVASWVNGAWWIWQAAKAQAVPEWISTEDKEPVENGNYLVCIDGDVFYLTAKWVKNHFKFLARGYGLTEDFTDWRYCEGVKVTHWMLLPDSPKAQEPAND